MTNEIMIGARIRELRQKKGLTQKDLAGDQITRNMLSLIESGTSCPSVSTLIYLAQRLDVPVGYLFTSTPEEEKSYHKANVMKLLKQAFIEDDLETCASLCSALPPAYMDDEISMIGAVSHLKYALEKAKQYAIGQASDELSRAADFSKHTVYLDHSFHRTIEYYTVLFRNLNTTETPSLLADLTYASSFVPHEMILYFRIMRSARDLKGPSVPLLNGTLYEKHIGAVVMMNAGQWEGALKLLKELSTDSDLPYFMQYRVLSDLENASNEAGDLRGAYVSARKKLELLETANR